MGYLGYFRYDGVEIVNDARLTAYTQNMGLGWFRCTNTCSTLEAALQERHWKGSKKYSDPKTDGAPWVDGDEPISYDFAGVSVLDATRLHDSMYSASGDESIADGAWIRPGRRRSREMVFRVLLVGKNIRAVHYGFAWLTTTLINGAICQRNFQTVHAYGDIQSTFLMYKRDSLVNPVPDNVYQAPLITGDPHTYAGLRESLLDFIPIVPQDETSTSATDFTDLRACMGYRLDFPPDCPDPLIGDRAWRYMVDVHCMEAPIVLSEHALGDECDSGAWMEVEFTLVAGNPGIWQEPVKMSDIQTNFNYTTFLPDTAAGKTWWPHYKDLASIPADDDVFQAPLVDGQPQTYNGLIRGLWDRTATSGPVTPFATAASLAVSGGSSTVVRDPLCPPLPTQPLIPQEDFLCAPLWTGNVTRLTYGASATRLIKYYPVVLTLALFSKDIDMRDIHITLKPQSRSGVSRKDAVDLYITYLPKNQIMYIDSIQRRIDLYGNYAGDEFEWTPADHLALKSTTGSAFDYPEVVCAGDFELIVDVPALYDAGALTSEFFLVSRDV